ncbi:hypothetical protein BDP27DRAFT_1432524 [Rhodocollybia butyracea]|uniref:Uncharacterized protein n=1 Tax=Rhodocollybia butyracea TaxID=206335 RepID=A0A9P5TWP4_9AGAR|nr:hypothetical protein BDP27DRAFT_1432524 [Rhodocollybia butyracea]
MEDMPAYQCQVDARNDWLGPELQDKISDAKVYRRIHPLMDVVEAFIIDCSKLDNVKLRDLSMLFYAGIPVWFVRPKVPGSRIRPDISWICENPWLQLLLPSGIVDCTDTTPAKPVIYHGSLQTEKYYIAIAGYMRLLCKAGQDGSSLANAIKVLDDESAASGTFSAVGKAETSSSSTVIEISDDDDVAFSGSYNFLWSVVEWLTYSIADQPSIDLTSITDYKVIRRLIFISDSDTEDETKLDPPKINHGGD